METPEAANKRFFITAGYFNNRQIVEAICENYPEYREKLPTEETPGGEFPEDGLLGYDNSQTIDILKIKFRSIETCIVDSVVSFKNIIWEVDMTLSNSTSYIKTVIHGFFQSVQLSAKLQIL